MTRDDIHKLIAGYATGTLTAAERQALFTAALDDQELFDQLAQEQELKELLDEPGVRQRLIASLEPASLAPARSASVFKAWRGRWSWVAAAATTGAIILGVYLSQPPEPKKLAVSLPQPRPIAPPQPAPFVPAPPQNAPAPPLPAPAAVGGAGGSVAPALPPPAPTPPAPAAAEQVTVYQAAPAPRREVGTVTAAAPPPPPPKAAPAAAPKVVPLTPEQSDRLSKLQLGGARDAGPVGTGAQNGFLSKSAAAVFGFTYSVTAEGRLRVVPSANGFLSVSAADQVLISNRALLAASATEVPLPVGATSATIVFSAQQIADSISSILKSPLDAPSGTITDPNPSATSRLEVVIPIPPRP
jgi:hypothetical protein